MKKSINFGTGVTMLLTLALTGCGDGDSAPGLQAAYQQGTNKCSQQFVSDYNNLIIIFKRARTESEVDAAQNAANQFGSTYKDVVCQAVVYDGKNQEAMINVNDNVAAWNAAIADYRAKHFSNVSGEQQSTPAEPNPYEATDEISRTGVTLRIRDAHAFNPAYNQSFYNTMAIQNGKLIHSWDVDYYSDRCMISYHEMDTGLRSGSQLKLQSAGMSNSVLDLETSNYSISLSCTKVRGTGTQFTIQDLNQILGSLATASIKQ